MSDENRQCPQCGAPLPSGAGQSMCTKCLLGLGLPGGGAVPDTMTISPLTSAGIPQSGVKFHYFGDFELLEEIARGGMGVVFRAHQESLNRQVALKLVLGERIHSSEARKRFQIEAEAAAKLDHPHIVPIYETGEHDGYPYLAMKLVEGEDLSRWLKKAPSRSVAGTKAAVEKVAKIARAIHYAHGRGVLHRDLKPSNILLDEQGEPFITDFGLAKFAESKQDLTRSEDILGTPRYLAPEQCQGGAVSTASDQYAVGVILYEWIAGKALFEADTPLALIRKVAEERPPELAATYPGVDSDLALICAKCLEKRPEDRYASCLALAEDLERWLVREPLAVRPLGPIERVWRWIRCKPLPTALTAAACLLVALSAFAAFNTWEKNREAARSRERLYAMRMNNAWSLHKRGNTDDVKRLLDLTRPQAGEEDLRDFEWRLLWQAVRLEKPIRTLGPASEKFSSRIAWRADGRLMLSNGASRWTHRHVDVWDPGATRASTTYKPHHDDTKVLGFCAETSVAAVGTDGQRIGLVSFLSNQSAERLVVRLSERENVGPAEFSNDGRYVLTSAWDPDLKLVRCQLYATETTELVYTTTVRAQSWRIGNAFLAVSGDGSRIAVASVKDGIRVIDWRRDQVLYQVEVSDLFNGADQLILSLSADGRYFTAGAGWSTYLVTLVDLETGEQRPLPSASPHARRARTRSIEKGNRESPPGSRHVSGLTFSPSGRKLLASGSPDAEIWDVTSGESLDIRKLAGGVHTAAFSPDESQIAFSLHTGEIQIFPLESKAVMPAKLGPIRITNVGMGRVLPGCDHMALTVPDPERPHPVLGRILLLMLGERFGETRLIDALGSNNIHASPLPGNRLLVSEPSGLFKVYDVGTDQIVQTIDTGLPGAVPARVFRKLNVILVGQMIEDKRPWYLFDLDSFERVITGSGPWSLPINVTADERYVACPGPDENEFPLREVAMNDYFLNGDPTDDHYTVDVVYGPDGELLGIQNDKVIHVRSGKVLFDDSNSVIRWGNEAIFLPGGRRILTDGGHLWDLRTGSPVITGGLSTRGWGELMQASPDGRVVVVQSNDGTDQRYVQVWQAPSWEEIAAIEDTE